MTTVWAKGVVDMCVKCVRQWNVRIVVHCEISPHLKVGCKAALLFSSAELICRWLLCFAVFVLTLSQQQQQQLSHSEQTLNYWHTHTEYSPTNSTGGHHSRAISYANTQRKHWWGRQDGTVITLRCTRQFYSPLSPHSTIENLSLSSHANNNNSSKAKKAAVNELKPFGYLDGLAKKRALTGMINSHHHHHHHQVLCVTSTAAEAEANFFASTQPRFAVVAAAAAY